MTWCCPAITFGKTHHRLHHDPQLRDYSPINISVRINPYSYSSFSLLSLHYPSSDIHTHSASVSVSVAAVSTSPCNCFSAVRSASASTSKATSSQIACARAAVSALCKCFHLLDFASLDGRERDRGGMLTSNRVQADKEAEYQLANKADDTVYQPSANKEDMTYPSPAPVQD